MESVAECTCIHRVKHTVDEEQALVLLVHSRLHRVLQELDGDLHGHDGTLLDVRLDHLAELAAGTVLLLAQQVARAEMLEAIVRYQLHALGALACTRAAEDKEDGDVVRGPERAGARGGAEVLDSRHCEM